MVRLQTDSFHANAKILILINIPDTVVGEGVVVLDNLDTLATILQLSVKHSTMMLELVTRDQWRSTTVNPTPINLMVASPASWYLLMLFTLHSGLLLLDSSLQRRLQTHGFLVREILLRVLDC